MLKSHYVIHGQVQGVGFRMAAARMAMQFHIKGYVQNLKDGSVELLALGSEEDLEHFLSELKRAFVIEQMTPIKGEPNVSVEYDTFKIKYQ